MRCFREPLSCGGRIQFCRCFRGPGPGGGGGGLNSDMPQYVYRATRILKIVVDTKKPPRHFFGAGHAVNAGMLPWMWVWVWAGRSFGTEIFFC